MVAAAGAERASKYDCCFALEAIETLGVFGIGPSDCLRHTEDHKSDRRGTSLWSGISAVALQRKCSSYTSPIYLTIPTINVIVALIVTAS